MLQLILLISLLVLTVAAFWQKGFVAGFIMALALVLSAIGAFMPSPNDDSFPVSLVFSGLGMIVLFIGVFKFFRKADVKH